MLLQQHYCATGGNRRRQNSRCCQLLTLSAGHRGSLPPSRNAAHPSSRPQKMSCHRCLPLLPQRPLPLLLQRRRQMLCPRCRLTPQQQSSWAELPSLPALQWAAVVAAALAAGPARVPGPGRGQRLGWLAAGSCCVGSWWVLRGPCTGAEPAHVAEAAIQKQAKASQRMSQPGLHVC